MALKNRTAALGILHRVNAWLDIKNDKRPKASVSALLIGTLLLNALRTHTHSRILGARLGFGDNAKLSLFASAVSMLPLIIPAGMVMQHVRLRAARRRVDGAAMGTAVDHGTAETVPEQGHSSTDHLADESAATG
jgi:hypothetical protein